MREPPSLHAGLTFVLGVLFLLALVLAAARAGQARAPAVQVSIAAQDTWRAGMHTSVRVQVSLASRDPAPLLLSPSSEGAAVEVVRGRLFRADATTLPDGSLSFEVPVIARSEGTAILRVEVATYVCEVRCRRVSASATQVLRVEPR